MPNKVYFPLSLALCFYILFFAISHIDGPLDWDELDVGSKLANREYQIEQTPKAERMSGIRIPNVIDPRKNVRNHFISTVSSLLSMDALGVTKLGLRLPALIFTVLLLALLLASKNLISKEGVILALAHLAVNGLTLWYIHSMRGYIAMVLFSTALYLIGLKWIKKGSLGKWERAGFYLLFYLTPLTHPFGGVFAVLLLATLTLLTVWQSAELKSKLLFLAPCFPVIPIVAYLFYCGMKFISRIGYLLSHSTPRVSDPLLALFGVNDRLSIYLLGFFFALALGLAIKQRQYKTYPFVFVVLSWGFAFTSLTLLKPSFFEPRFILPFLLPTLFWLATLNIPKHHRAKWAIIGALLIFLPWAKQEDHPATTIEWVINYDKFVNHAKTYLAADRNCFIFSGEHDQVYFSESLFFKNAAPCANFYQMHFGRNWEGEIPLEKDPRFEYELKYEDGQSNRLFHLTSPPPLPVFSG